MKFNSSIQDGVCKNIMIISKLVFIHHPEAETSYWGFNPSKAEN